MPPSKLARMLAPQQPAASLQPGDTGPWHLGAAHMLPAEVYHTCRLQVPRTQAGTGWLEPGKSSIELSQCITRAVPVSARRSSVGKVSCRAWHAWLVAAKALPGASIELLGLACLASGCKGAHRCCH